MEKQDCGIRLRLMFEHRRVLTKQQRTEGFDRCWFLLRPELSKVSDLACDITGAFHLQSTCPDGLLLSMDEFVLPPFVSTAIFRDRDLVRVRKNKVCRRKAIQLFKDEENMNTIECERIIEKQPRLTCRPILAIEEFEKESGGYRTEEEEDLANELEETNALNTSPAKKAVKKKKRKRNDIDPSSSKRSKHQVNDSENLASLCEGRQTVDTENNHVSSSEENTTDIQGNNKSYKGCDTAKVGEESKFNGINEDKHFSSVKRRKKSKETTDQATVVVEGAGANDQEDISLHIEVESRRQPNEIHQLPDGNDINLKNGGDGKDVLKGITESDSVVKRQEPLQENSERTAAEPQANGDVEKVPSRSARRKKAKRRWLREAKLSASKLEAPPILNNYKDDPRCSDSQDITVSVRAITKDAVTPVVVRPGHIRFEHNDEDAMEENEGLHADQTFHSKFIGSIEWNGTLDKKKGQKWGRTKSSSTWNSEKNFSWDGQSNTNAESKSNAERKTVQPEDFEKLCHMTRFPKVGDVVVYRLVELSSSWCPEVSSFRVGRVISCDPITTRCTLVPVPGYAIPLDKAAEESDTLPEQPLYKDDGSLEIEFTSLVDVRLLDGVESGLASVSSCWSEPIESGPSILGNSGGEERTADSPEAFSEKKDANDLETWEEDITKALEKKKAELQQRNGYHKHDNSPPAKPSWSRRALRGSALGPTISLLRANNAL